MWKTVVATYRAFSALSTAQWLWGLPWAGFPAVLVGVWAWLRGIPLPISIAMALALGVICYAAWVLKQIHRGRIALVGGAPPAPILAPAPQEMSALPELEQLFLRDFERGPRGTTLQLHREQGLEVGGEMIKVRIIQALLYDAHAMLVGLYIPATVHTLAICMRIPDHIEEYLLLDTVDPAIGGACHEEVRASELTFTGKVFIYYESTLTLAEQGRIDGVFRNKGLRLQLRSTVYSLSTKKGG